MARVGKASGRGRCRCSALRFGLCFRTRAAGSLLSLGCRFGQGVPGCLPIARNASSGPLSSGCADRWPPTGLPKDPSSPELGRYAFHLWVSPVSDLLSQDLASYLGERGVATRVMTSGTSIAPDYTVRGRVVKMQHTLGPKAAAVLELQLTLTDDRQRKVLLHKAYSASQPANSVADAAKAFGEEAQGIFGEFVADCSSRMGGGGSSAE